MNARVLSRNAVVWLAALIGLAAANYVRAEEPVADPPGRVARLSLKDGEVSLAPAGTEEWADAVLNRPITSGDRLWVDKDGRAELQIGTASVHLDRSTGFEFIELGDDVMQMSLTEGVATIRVRTLGDRESIQMETPNATVKFLHPGDYTVQVDPDSDRTIVRTRNGEAEVSGASKTFRVRADEEGTFTGLDGLTANIGRLPPRTAFESWANDRDRRGDDSEAARYVSREVVGYEDLDGQGQWVNEPQYGYVWTPSYVVSDWAPYRYGRWGWVSPWGWTWIDDARWGFAPFHYGRWAFARHRWCWVPGPRYIRPYYAPALVGWIGGPSVSVSVAFGSGVGWFPLAPHEVYVPWYRHTPRYVRHVNVSNTIIVNNINVTNIYGRRGAQPRYTYSNIGSAVTAAQRDAFISGRPVGAHRVQVNDRELRQWRGGVHPSTIVPDRQSILAGQPRRPAPPPVAFAGDNPKRGGSDFRATRVAAEQIKRAQATQSNLAPESRIALREAAPQQSDRVQSMRGREQTDRVSERSERTETPRAHDHMERAPAVQSLQSSPSTERRLDQGGSNEMRRPRESSDNRDTFHSDDSNRRQFQTQPRETREQPPARQFSQPEVRQAPVERREAPPVQHEQPREQPRIERSEPREVHSSPPPQQQRAAPQASSQPQRQNNNQGSSNSNRHSGSNSSDDNNGRPDRR
jgi:Family of unknown function (DUF6600)